MPKMMTSESSDAPRGRHGRRVSSTLAEINVVPLVDVMLVLLIIFMVAAPMLQRGVEVNLPVARQTQKMTEERVYITVPLTYQQDQRVFLDDEAISAEVLAERIRQAMIGKDQNEVFLRTDGGVRMQEVLDVMDRLKEGGIERVGLVALPRGPQ